MPSSVGYLLILWKSCTQWNIYFRTLVLQNPKIIVLLDAVLSENPLETLPMYISVRYTMSLNNSNTYSKINWKLGLLLNPRRSIILWSSSFIVAMTDLLFWFLINPYNLNTICSNPIGSDWPLRPTLTSQILIWYRNLVSLWQSLWKLSIDLLVIPYVPYFFVLLVIVFLCSSFSLFDILFGPYCLVRLVSVITLLLTR